jgi:hypothetical protein
MAGDGVSASLVTMTSFVEHPIFWTDAYWLEHCEGFRVDSPGGCLGYVEEVVWSDGHESPVALRVRRGFDEHGTLLVDLDDVVELHQESCSILVRAGARRPTA